MAAQVTYRLATPEDYISALTFVRDHFYPEEPLNIACEPLEQDTYDEKANLANLYNNPRTCLVAECADEIVGACICGLKDPNEVKCMLAEASHIPGTKWARMLYFLATIEQDANVFERYNVDKAIHGCMLAVHNKFRGRGIGLMLMEKAMKRAKELGYSLYTTDCTSTYSARLCERLGMDCVNIASYVDYREQNSDEQVFFPSGKDKYVKTFAMRL